MPYEQIFLSMTAMLVLIAGMMGTGLAETQKFNSDRHAGKVEAAPQNVIIDCRIVGVKIDESEIVVRFKGMEKNYQLSPTAKIVKDGQPAALVSLAQGDLAMLQLTAPRSSTITRLIAMTPR